MNIERDIVIIGPLNIDVIAAGQAPARPEELTSWVGPSKITITASGSAGYIAQVLVMYGWKIGVVSTLADDPIGDLVYHYMGEAGVDVSRVQRERGKNTALALYMLLFGDGKRPMTYRMPDHVPWPSTFTADDRSYIFNARHLHCAGYLQYPDMWKTDQMANLFCEAKARGLTTSLDPNFVDYQAGLEPLKDVLKYTDLFFADREEATQISQVNDLNEAGRILREAGAGIVAIKQSVHGSLIFSDMSSFHQPVELVPQTDYTDSIGAGDAFDSGFITGYLSGWTIDKCARFAARTAALMIRRDRGTILSSWRRKFEQALESAKAE